MSGVNISFLDLKISESAKQQIRALFRDNGPGSMLFLLMPFVGIERRRIIEFGFYSPVSLNKMIMEYARWGASLVQDCSGMEIAIYDDDMLDELKEKVLLFSDGKCSLGSN